MGSSNTFSRALKHMKASKPSRLHEEVPTNNTQGLYRVEPNIVVMSHPNVDDPDFDQDGDGSSGYDGKDTSGLFMPDGTIRVAEPPGDTTAILGPMASMWYAWGNFSTFGYIRQSDRKMVNLGRITGKLSDWDGVSNFTSYNSGFTIDQAVWFRDVEKYGGISNDPAEANYRAFYPGPPSNTPDQYGRYYCTTTGKPKNQPQNTPPPNVPPEGAGFPWFPGHGSQFGGKGGPGGGPGNPFGEGGPMGPGTPIGDALNSLWNNITSFAQNGLPAANYATDIAMSILSGEPIVKDQADIPQSVIDALANGLPDSAIAAGDMKVTDTPINYSDDNFYVDNNGKVHAHTPETLQQYPNNTGPVGYPQSYGGLDNPLAAAGQAQVQFVYPSDGSEPYMQYTDHAYHNVNSTDPGEVPDPIKKGLSHLTHAVAGYGQAPTVGPNGVPIPNFNLDTTTPNTGGMEGYPPNIRGDVVTNVKIPVNQLPQNVQDQIGKVLSNPTVYHEHPINQKTKKESFNFPRLPRRTNKVSNLNESHTLDVIKNIKKPVVIEEKKEKVKRRPRVIGSEPRTINSGLMKQAEVPASFKKPEERMWGKYEREQNARASQDRKNVVLDHLGNADQAWEYLLDRNAGKRSFAGYFEKDGTPKTIFTDGKVKTVTREEKVGSDTVIFFTDEEGKKGSILQSEYNELQDQSQAQQMFAEYEATVATEEENDFDKIANKLELKAEKNPTNDKIQSMLSSYRALSHLKKEDKKNEAHFVSWKSSIDGKITNNLQSWVDSVGKETADAVSVAEAMTSGDMFVRTQLEPTGEEIRVPIPSDSFRYNQSDAVTTTDGVVKFGEVAPHNYLSNYWWRQTAGTNYITTTDVPGEQTVTHVTFDVDLGTGIDAPLPNHPLKVEYQMIYRDSNGNTYNAGTGTLGSITAGGKTSFELPKYHEYFEISFDLTVDGTWMRSYELDYQRRMFVGTNFYGMTLTADDIEDSLGPIAMIHDILHRPGGYNEDDASSSMHVFLHHTRTNGQTVYASLNPMPSVQAGGPQGHTGADREFLYNLIRSQYAHLKDRYAQTYTIKSMGLTRVAPITVWVPLDSPEAVSFMRTAPEMAGLTPAQRLKKLKEMLKSGNEYLIKMLGYQGSTATPGPNEPADYLDGADELLNDVSPEEQAEIEKNLAKLGPEYAKLAAIPAAIPLLASPAGQAALAAGAAAVGTLLIQAGIDIGNTMQSSADWDYDDSTEQESQSSPESEMKDRQRSEAAEADKALQDAIDQYGADSEEAREARQAKNDTLTRHKKERKSIGGKDDRGKGKETSGMTSRGDTKSGTNDTWYGEQVTRKGRYLSDSKTFKKQSFSKWYGSMESDTADKVISDAKIETKDQVLELVFDEFNRLRLQEGMTSKGFEYIYGLAVSNIVSQYGIDSKFASDLLHASADTTDYEFGPNFPGSYVNSIGDYEVDSSRKINVNAYYDSKFGSVSGSGGSFTLRTVDGPSGASRSSLQSALGITLPSGISGALGGTPIEGSAVQRIFTGAQPGNIINFNWGFTSSEKGLPQDIKVDDYAFVAITGRVTKIVSILQGGDVRGGSFRYRLKPGDIDGNGNVKVAIGVMDVFDDIYNTTLRINSFGSLYAGDIGSIGDTTDAADLGAPVNNLDPKKKKKKPSYMDIQVGDERVVKVDGETYVDTSTGYYNKNSGVKLTPAQMGKIATNVAGGTKINPSLQAIGSQGKGLGGAVKIGQHGTGPKAAKSIKKGGFKSGSRSNVYGTKGVFLDPSKSGAAADEFARAGAAAEAGGRTTTGRSAAQRAADLKAGRTAGKGVKIPVAYKPGTGSRMNIPGTKYAEVGVSADKATKGARLAQNAVTKYPNSAKAKQLVRTGATTAKVGAARGVAAKLGKAVPIAGAAISIADAGYRASQGDYAGAALSGLTAVPGPVGWIALAAQIATDAAGITGRSKKESYINMTYRGFVRESTEYKNYQEYVDRAKETIDKNNLKLDKNLLDVLKMELGLSDKLSDEDKEYLVDIFDNPDKLKSKEVSKFIKKIVPKLSSKN